MTTYQVTLGVTARVYKTFDVEAGSLLELMQKSRDVYQYHADDLSAWEAYHPVDDNPDPTICWATVDSAGELEEVLVDVELDFPDAFPEIAKQVEEEDTP